MFGDDGLEARRDEPAPGTLPPHPLPEEGEVSSSDGSERIHQIFRSIHFYPATRSREAKWPSSDEVLGVQAGELLLDRALIGDTLSALPSLPMAVMDLLGSTDDEDIPIDVLAEKIEMDQGLVARLLRVANSAFYGLQRKVRSVPDAIVVLGTGNVHNLALAVSLSDGFTGKVPTNGLHLPTFWRHSFGVAICARILADRMRCNRNSAFAAGLLHDIGRVVLAMHFPRHMAGVRRYQDHLDCQLFEAERMVLGIDHAQIGQLMAERWNFPEVLCAPILGHHEPEVLDRNALGCVIHLADAMMHAIEMASGYRERFPRVFASCWQAANLSWTDCQEILVEVEQGLANFERLLGTMRNVPN